MFKLNIATGDEPKHEICRILRDVTDHIERDGYLHGSCYDAAGNTVGNYDFLVEPGNALAP